jgi:hypothetical protein
MKRLLVLGVFVLAACGSSSNRTGFDDTKPADGTPPGTPPAPTGDFNKDPAPPPPPPEVHEVYGHSSDTLYRLDPDTNAVTVVAKFSNCAAVIDIALDESSNLYATGYSALYKVDKATAACTEIATGTYPNSLSFVPKGTLDASAEALVGYEGSDYVRIDPSNGNKSTVKAGALTGSMISSGDVVSVKGGATYLTVKDNSQCASNDCLVEVDPKTGKVLKNWGTVGHNNVFGISFWGGKIYGFDDKGELFELTFGTSSVTSKTISIPGAPSGLSFWGAGSTTSAPLVSTPQ